MLVIEGGPELGVLSGLAHRGKGGRPKAWIGRPGGRPVVGNGHILTVGRSTGRSKLTIFAANGYIF